MFNEVFFISLISIVCVIISLTTSLIMSKLQPATFSFLDKKYFLFGSILTAIGSIIGHAISSNIYLSLGMLGALSIIRFRTPIRSVIEMAVIFFYVSLGIISAASILYSFSLGLIIVLIVFCYSYFEKEKANESFSVILTTNQNTKKLFSDLDNFFYEIELKGKYKTDSGGEEFILYCQGDINKKIDAINFLQNNKNIKDLSTL